MEWEWQIGLIFVIVGVILFIVEVASPGFFVAIPASVLIILGALGMILDGFFLSMWSPIVAIGVTVPAFLGTMYAYKRLAPPQPPTTTVGRSLVGKRGIVDTDIIPNTIKGKVRIENQTWSATSDHYIPKDTLVEVVQSRGVHVIVREVQEQGP
ncbi:MAG: NfeD family protein [Thermoplasmata archaeon]|nr:NfeD family protein [Thermoplasmata archaeon]MCK5585449.1 NfeD family protein [Candidatus Bipolaricaulota bacterium]